MINLSIILPFYGKAKLFQVTYPLNEPVYTEPETEIICVLDDPSEESEILNFAKTHPAVRMRVIVNDEPHDWRTPAKAYNVGIQHALGSHCVLFDPESILQLPTPDYLRALTAQDFRRNRAGMAWHIPEIDPGESVEMLRRRIMAVEAVYAPSHWGFGFLLAHRHELVLICGFDESRTLYGGDDDDIRIRLTRMGVITEIDPLIKIFHILHDNPYDRVDQEVPLTPNVVLANQRETWGHAFGRIAYDWAVPQETPNNAVNTPENASTPQTC